MQFLCCCSCASPSACLSVMYLVPVGKDAFSTILPITFPQISYLVLDKSDSEVNLNLMKILVELPSAGSIENYTFRGKPGQCVTHTFHCPGLAHPTSEILSNSVAECSLVLECNVPRLSFGFVVSAIAARADLSRSRPVLCAAPDSLNHLDGFMSFFFSVLV